MSTPVLVSTSPASNRKSEAPARPGTEDRLGQLIAFAQTTDLQEVVWEKNGSRVSFRRSTAPARPEALSEEGVGAPAAEPATAVQPRVIRSTMVGTFYRSESPDRPPFVVEGTNVQAGQPVAAIEAMKIRKDVLAPEPCTIVKALVVNGHPVEYGQPLFEILPEAGHV